MDNHLELIKSPMFLALVAALTVGGLIIATMLFLGSALGLF